MRVMTYSNDENGDIQPESHMISVHRRDGSFYIIGGERECRVFRCKDKGRLGDLLYTKRGRVTLLSAILGNDIFRYVDFPKDGVLLVPKVFRK